MSKKYVAFIGRMHSGKDVVCEILSELVAPRKVDLIRFSDPLGACLVRMKQEMPGCSDIVLDREHYQNFSTIIRQELDQDILADWVYRTASVSPAEWVLIMGMRKMQDLPAMRRLPECTIVNVQAPQDLRLLWTQRSTRKKGLFVPTRESFLAQDNQECEVDIDTLAKHADFSIVNDRDDATLKHLKPRVKFLADQLTI